MKSLLKKILMPAAFVALAGVACAQYASPMQQAIVQGDKTAVKNLLDNGYWINTLDEVINLSSQRKKVLVTPLQMALHYRQVNIAKMMIEDYKADINFITAETALHEALWDDVPLLQYMLERGAKPNLRDDRGDSPLHVLCAARDWPQGIDVLLKYQADINARGFGGGTPLHNAAYVGHLGDIQALIDHNANLNIKDDAGDTALHIAVRAGNTNAAKLLIMAGAKVNVKNRKGQTVLDIAQSGTAYKSMYVKAIIKQKQEKEEMQKLKAIAAIVNGTDANTIRGIK